RVFPPQEVALEQALADIDQIVKQCRTEGGIAPDVIIRPSGSADKLSQTREAMIGKWTGFNWESFFSILTGRFALSLLITYLLMAALFENWVYPFVILFSVPLALAGGFMGLAWMHWHIPTQQMDTLSMLGFVILIGVVVNNAILIVHQALNFMRGRGESESDVIEKMPPRKAIAESVRTRIRPIFMTSCTSVFGMLPLVLSPGSGSELYCGLGAVVLGGLAISSIFTLTVVPLLMSLVIDFMQLFKRKSDAEVEQTRSEVEPA
ncbi:MAG: efflux RND transporter permease subunit, partial [Thermoguttaceae bacterium]|nr:efflux RND transporter permease subunit [Thermoguttaceae bacterium]